MFLFYPHSFNAVNHLWELLISAHISYSPQAWNGGHYIHEPRFMFNSQQMSYTPKPEGVPCILWIQERQLEVLLLGTNSSCLTLAWRDRYQKWGTWITVLCIRAPLYNFWFDPYEYQAHRHTSVKHQFIHHCSTFKLNCCWTNVRLATVQETLRKRTRCGVWQTQNKFKDLLH